MNREVDYRPTWRQAGEKETEMRNCVYVVYRYGSNAANQSRCNKRIVGTVKAGSRAEACRLMADEVTVYRNQWLSAVPASKVGKTDRMIATKLDAWRAAECAAQREFARRVRRLAGGRA